MDGPNCRSSPSALPSELAKGLDAREAIQYPLPGNIDRFQAHQAGFVFFRRDYYRLQHDVSPVVLTAFARPVKHFR